MIKVLTLAALWILGALFLLAGFYLRDPYLILLRGWGNVIILAINVAIIGLMLWHGRGAVGTPLIALWCLSPLAMLHAEASFQLEKRAVLATERQQALQLGQHFIVGYRSFDDVAPLAEKGLIGGIYVTRHNIHGRPSAALKVEIAALQEKRRAAGLPPLVVAADQEGGIVSHLSPQLTSLPALATLELMPSAQRQQKAEEFGRVHGRELAALGVNLNFAPVVDIRPEIQRRRFDFNTLIGRRAISNDPAIVAEIALAYTRGLDASGVGATVKHFPGLGRVHDDTHHFRASLDTPIDELEASDWRPFRTLLSSSNTQLMVGHVALTAIDADRPASHAKRVIDGLIRKTWGYDGVIITDDLVMGAIYQNGLCTAVVEALNAGVDQLLVAFDGAQFYRAFACALKAQAQGKIDRQMLSSSRDRLRRLSLETQSISRPTLATSAR